MSHTIIYNRLILKLGEDKVMLLLEVGDNNVYISPRKRARSWGIHNPNGGFTNTIEELKQYPEKFLNDLLENYEEEKSKIIEDFGNYLCTRKSSSRNYLSYTQFKNLYNPNRGSHTVEDLHQNGGRLFFRIRNSNMVDANLTMEQTSPKTTMELLNALEVFKSIGFKHIAVEVVKPKATKRKVDKSEWPFAIKSPRYGYFVRKTKYGFKWNSSNYNNCKKFKKMSDAQRYIDKHGLTSRGFKPIDIKK